MRNAASASYVFSIDDEHLKRAGGGNYFDELLARIRDVRSSEKVFWRKVLDIYATSIDYDPRVEASQRFFKTVQNMMQWRRTATRPPRSSSCEPTRRDRTWGSPPGRASAAQAQRRPNAAVTWLALAARPLPPRRSRSPRVKADDLAG